tara:strand:- start:639 stop:839 length:201 start_codon:yes stop_codon:yes gene_type:complete
MKQKTFEEAKIKMLQEQNSQKMGELDWFEDYRYYIENNEELMHKKAVEYADEKEKEQEILWNKIHK